MFVHVSCLEANLALSRRFERSSGCSPHPAPTIVTRLHVSFIAARSARSSRTIGVTSGVAASIRWLPRRSRAVRPFTPYQVDWPLATRWSTAHEVKRCDSKRTTACAWTYDTGVWPACDCSVMPMGESSRAGRVELAAASALEVRRMHAHAHLVHRSLTYVCVHAYACA
jgi:hypothetical protein